MPRIFRIPGVCPILAAISALVAAGSAEAATCESLKELGRLGMTVTLAQHVGPGELASQAQTLGGGRGPAASVLGALPAFCRVSATLAPTSDSAIGIEVWMPQPWNGKVQTVGNGAWAGTISYGALATAIRAGYAAASTDTGHTGGNANFMVGHPEKLVDFEYRAVHETAAAAKAIASAFYGSSPKQAYFNGCSTGGRQALTAVQRYPADFDGVIAGAPANYAKRQTFGQMWLWQATHKDEASFLTEEHHAVLHRAAVAACDALDGVRDGVLEDPSRCRFDPKVVQCKGTGDAPGCLTAPQVEAARAIYAGASNPRTKEPLYPGLQPGSELGWRSSVGAQPVGYAIDFFRYVVFKDPAWDAKTLNYDSHVALVDTLDTGLNAVEADLSPFVARGGKLLMYHGWSDPGIPPSNLVNYHNSVLAKTKSKGVRDAVRTFMVPGMGHCGGGEGTSTFDMVAALDQWVSSNKAPDLILASRVVDGKVVRTRPLCAYPQVAVYKGTGSTDEAASFVCGASAFPPQSAAQAPAGPTVIGPIALTSALRDASNGYPFNASTMELAKRGFVEEEFFLSGNARAYDIPRDQAANATAIDGSHPYRTRIVVRRPVTAGKFNGTAIVEWNNVSEGFDNEVDWFNSGEHFVRAGYVWVGVSAQRVGVDALKRWSAARYGSLDVTDGGTATNDVLSYDIFTDAARAVRGTGTASVLGSLRARRLIATGHSQSAGRLATYFNTVHPIAPVFDGVLLHGGGGKMRTDLNVKIWKLLAETDVLGQLASRQPDSDTFRTWEVAGASHLDLHHARHLVDLGLRDSKTMLPSPPPAAPGRGPGGGGAGPGRGNATPGPYNGCERPPLSHIPASYVQNALYDHFAAWLASGKVPPSAPPIDTRTDGPRPAIARDADGNATGGIRLAEHAVPTGMNSGENVGTGFCFLTGAHQDFPADRLAALYPTRAAYVSAVKAATEKNLKAGYIVKADAARTIAAAERADLGKR